MTEPQSVARRRTIAGWPLGHVLMAALMVANAVWSAWATKSLVELQERRIVAVGLNGLVSDFVATESRRTASPDQAAARTRIYLAALDHAVGELEQDGTVVLVKESVLGHGVPDQTALVRARVEQALERAP